MRAKTFFSAALCASATLVCLTAGAAGGARARAAGPTVIRETPPAPVFTEEERVAELRARRARVAERIGKTAVLVMFSAEPRVYANDVDYEFRQENNLYYLTNLRQQGATFVMLPGGENSREYRQEQEFASTWAKSSTGFSVRTAWPIFAEMRMRKSPSEIALMQHAIDISIEGHQRAQAVASRTQWEYETEAEIDYTYKRRNADNWGYPNIVGCGPDATTLHYEESSGRVRPGDLLLIDAGAEYGHYSADVTRTFPVSGKFTKEQADIYNIVLAAQEAAFKAVRPGANLSDVHNAALEVVKDGLLKLGLITDKNTDQYRVWFMHGTSHYLGMNVHDVSARGAKLDAGMVFTVEPGVYLRPDALDYLPKTPENEKFIAAVRPAFEKYKGIGVRIEDDVLVTPDGYRNLSGALARTIPDIEAFMARAQKEVRAE